MIDTIALTFKQSDFVILEPSHFTPSASLLYQPSDIVRLGGRANIMCKQNPTKKEMKQGIYKPRLSLTKRYIGANKTEVTLRVELSIPKLLFGNNFDELEDSDYDAVKQKLIDVLRTMGVRVYKSKLDEVGVSAIHYGKNIILTDHTTPYAYLKEIAKANISKRLDFNQTDFRNGGHSIKYHTNSLEVTFYDKIMDLEKGKQSDKRAIEKDNTLQLNFLDQLEKRKAFEVLRMEVRLNKRQKIRALFKSIGVESDLSFRSVFSKAIAKQVLCHYMQEIQDASPPFLLSQFNGVDSFLSSFIAANPDAPLMKTLAMLGLKLAVDKLGSRELRTILGKYSDRQWYYLVGQVRSCNQVSRLTTYDTLWGQLKAFESVKMVDYDFFSA